MAGLSDERALEALPLLGKHTLKLDALRVLPHKRAVAAMRLDRCCRMTVTGLRRGDRYRSHVGR